MGEVVCLQGGAEFSDACVAMDTEFLAVAGGGPVVVLASAAAQGREYATAGANASRYYARLGASVSVAPDPRDDLGGAVEALRSARARRAARRLARRDWPRRWSRPRWVLP